MDKARVTQIGVVVNDLEKTMESYYNIMGWGPWRVYELKKPRHHDTKLNNINSFYTSRIAETTVGGIDFVLIQQLEGESIYKDNLKKYGEGMDHIACMSSSQDYKRDIERYKKEGFEVVMNGSIDDIHYFYLNTESELKFILELGSGHASSLEPDWVFPEEQANNNPISITQIAVVTSDIKESLEKYNKIIGWGPWNVYELNNKRLDETSVYGEDSGYSSIIAETDLGNVDFELIEPISGDNIYSDYIKEKGELLHHLACMGSNADFKELREYFIKECGFNEIMTGRIDKKINYYYLNTESALKLILESGSGHARSLTPDWTYPNHQ